MTLNRLYVPLLFLIAALPLFAFSQTTEVYDDFEGNSNIVAWNAEDCALNPNFANPYPEDINTSATVLRYSDTGGQYANASFDTNENFDLSQNQTFSIKIYVPASGLTGNQPNQVSLKLQDGNLAEPWSTQSEIIKPVALNRWQTVTFDFENDNYQNLNPGSVAPTLRTDFNRVVIQVNGENNNDHVLAFIDDLLLYETPNNDPVFDKLIWSDEFNTNGAVDTTKWYHQTQLPEGNSWFNNEIQHYTDRTDNSFVRDGALHIVAKRETFTDQGVTKDFTSARLNSKFAFTYGRVEVRAKLPSGVGTWPAIWTLGKNIDEIGGYWDNQGFGTVDWPACGEMDIMEHWGDNQGYVSSATHTPSSFGGTINTGGQNIPDVSTEFHVYTLVWTDKRLIFSVDGVTHFTYNPTTKDPATWPFNSAQYMLFNVAILPIIEPGFVESTMEIDYIRIYQEEETTAISDAREKTTLIYPNPFNDMLRIDVEATTSGVAALAIYNSTGALVRQEQVVVNNGRFTVANLGDLTRGLYVIRYVLGDKVYYHKVMKY